MSRENVEKRTRRGSTPGTAATSTSGLPASPRKRSCIPGRFADQGVYRGRAGLERYWAEIREDIEELSLSVSDMRAIGDRVFFAATGRGLGKLSKVPIEQPIWFVTTLRDGLAVRVETYVDSTEALEAAGLRE